MFYTNRAFRCRFSLLYNPYKINLYLSFKNISVSRLMIYLSAGSNTNIKRLNNINFN